MANIVFLDEDGLIHNIYDGDQTGETVNDVVRQTSELVERLKKEQKPILILVDLSKIGKSTMASRQAALRALHGFVYDRIGLFGANVFLKHVANLIIVASGMDEKVKYFKSEAEARKWLGAPAKK